tara:strand:+ start:632 stop:817 length:186 start_codon:yes stop_codon:yes gene_type:complete
MQMPLFSDLFGPPAVQARFRRDAVRGRGIYELARELAGLAGLLGWLAVLFYLIAVFSTGLN